MYMYFSSLEGILLPLCHYHYSFFPFVLLFSEEDTPSDSSGIDTSSPLFSPVREMTSPVKNLETVM